MVYFLAPFPWDEIIVHVYLLQLLPAGFALVELFLHVIILEYGRFATSRFAA